MGSPRAGAGVSKAPASPTAAGAPAVRALGVEDGDATARLVGEGPVLLHGPQDRLRHIRTAAFRDPSGAVREIAGAGS